MILPSFLFAKKTSPITKRRACAMNNENKQIKLDRSLRTQLPSKENAVNLHSVKEVCKRTGLSRKQLFDYQKMVQPVTYDKSGYKLYDENAINRLLIIAELRSIDVPLAEIKNVLEGKINKMSVIMNQITVLEDQKKRVDEMLINARRMLNTN